MKPKINNRIMRFRSQIITVFLLLISASAFSQNQNGLSSGPTVQNGNGSLANSYSLTACGLNYTGGKVKLTQRYQTPGPAQPAPITISGLPNCFIIQAAFLYIGIVSYLT